MNEQRTVPGRRFFFIVSGKTNGADREIIYNLQHLGQIEVDSIENCDFVVDVCPVASRVETDINEALSKVQTDKPIILIVMHHTFDPERVIAESRRQVNNTNVILTVDLLFHEGKLLNCNRNNISWYELGQVLGVPIRQKAWSFYTCAKNHPLITLGVILGVGFSTIFAIVVVSVLEIKHKL